MTIMLGQRTRGRRATSPDLKPAAPSTRQLSMSDAAPMTLPARVRAALDTVLDPEIRKPITDLGMVEDVQVDPLGRVKVKILLTVAGCPLRNTIENDVANAIGNLKGVNELQVELGVMSPEQRAELTAKLRGGVPAKTNPFADPNNLTTVLAISSGKGGVGKSSMTVNLAVAMAAQGLRVGLLDADIYGHSIPDMMGIGDSHPTVVDDMIMPVPAHGVKVMSIGMLKESRDQVIAWRGPMLDKALNQMLTDVFWGDLDFLLVDLPPGTGDMAMSVGRLLPTSQVIVVTTPQQAAAEVAERAGTMAVMMNQPVLGVVENMSWLEATCPHCGGSHRVDVFGYGGGEAVSAALSERTGKDVALLAQIPLDEAVRQGGDSGDPVVLAEPDRPSAAAIRALAGRLAARPRGLVGRPLGVHPTQN